MPEKRRRNSLGHFPLTIDPWGGMLRTTGEGKNREINFSLRGEGGLSLSREVNGADWRLSSGTGWGTIDVCAREDVMVIACYLPHVVLEYSRSFGILRKIVISGVDLVALVGIKVPLAAGDMTNVDDLKEMMEDRIIHVAFAPEGPQFVVVSSSGREIAGMVRKDENSLAADNFNFVSGPANDTWRGDLGFLRGKIGFGVFSDKVTFFYEKMGRGTAVRQDVMEVSQTVLGVAGFDRRVTQGLPSEEELIKFIDGVYLSRL